MLHFGNALLRACDRPCIIHYGCLVVRTAQRNSDVLRPRSVDWVMAPLRFDYHRDWVVSVTSDRQPTGTKSAQPVFEGPDDLQYWRGPTNILGCRDAHLSRLGLVCPDFATSWALLATMMIATAGSKVVYLTHRVPNPPTSRIGFAVTTFSPDRSPGLRGSGRRGSAAYGR